MMSKLVNRVVSVQEIQRLDKVAIEEIGIPSMALTENVRPEPSGSGRAGLMNFENENCNY